ncbi:chaperonin GroEL [Chlamydiifrater phoenicopteri]|uniref:chaperonin GroEL n=1 Tax=Chlamydiifrater phoenicopteri TaxID=2681469 RepID=UPI001BCE86FF|nr:chaperonin GroEL [Chlamydiifrater phoenicopteri]
MTKVFNDRFEGLKAVSKGVQALARAVSATLGPKGRNVILKKPASGPVSTKDGATVTKEVELEDPFENMGVKLLREASIKTADEVGDGSSTSVVLAAKIFQEGMKGIASGMDVRKIIQGISLGAKKIDEALTAMATPIKKDEEVLQIASVSASNDPAIGNIIAEAMKRVGNDGMITIAEGRGVDTVLEVVEGMSFDQGYASPYFVTSPETMTVELEYAYVGILDHKLSSVSKPLISFLEKVVAESKSPLVLIAEDFDDQVLTTLVVNKLKGGFPVCAVKAPNFGDRRKAVLSDIALLSGATVISSEVGLSLDKVGTEVLGKVKKISVAKDKTVLIGGCGSPALIDERVRLLKGEIRACESDYERSFLEERLAKLSGGVAVIKLGAITEAELKEKKYRVEDALHATKAAVSEGIVPGGGVALAKSSLVLEGINGKCCDENFGLATMCKAAKAPLLAIASNCGREGEVVLEQVLAQKDKNFGYNGLTDAVEDLVASGVLDPVLVTRSALKNAVSMASMLLSSAYFIADKPSKKNSSGTTFSGGSGFPGM